MAETKNILITGASKGIGFETARKLGLNGHHILLAARDAGRLDGAVSALRAEGVKATPLLMDVSSQDSVRQAAATFAQMGLKLNVIINNAAILQKADRSLVSDSTEMLEQTLCTNCHGPLLVIQSFLSYLSKPARIINLSSQGGSMTDPVGGWSPAYCVSKSMLNAMTRHLASELASKGVSVNAVCPGWVRSDMGGPAAPRSLEQGADTPAWLAVDADASITGKFLRDRKVIPW
jgi:NAD(P)-dependent dehydrogenase (short-subunit alcohol dehydrogenase family)